MSALRRKADPIQRGCPGPELAKSGHWRVLKGSRDLAHCDAGGWEPSTASKAAIPRDLEPCREEEDRQAIKRSEDEGVMLRPGHPIAQWREPKTASWALGPFNVVIYVNVKDIEMMNIYTVTPPMHRGWSSNAIAGR